MATQALYRKWRSQTFGEVIGQVHVTQTLENAIKTNRLGHAYLFTGPRGTGKTSTARILAKAVNCIGSELKPCNTCSICQAITEGRFMDLIEIDAASNTSVDDIRDLRDKIDFRPSEGHKKFYIIDEVHMLSKSAFNALLKTLEEPPPHVVFVLATTEPEKIPATITSRCQRFDFKRIQLADVTAWLKHILEQEDLQAEEAALIYVARQGGGSMRDSISLLDQLTAYGDKIISLDLVRSVLGAINVSSITDLVDHIIQQDVAAGLNVINTVVNEGVESRQFTLEVLGYLRSLLLVKHGQTEKTLNLSPDIFAAMQVQVQQISTSALLNAIQRLNQAVKDFKSGAGEAVVPQLPLELAFVEIATRNGQPTALLQNDTSETQPQPQPKITPKPPQLSPQPTPVAPPPVTAVVAAVSAPSDTDEPTSTQTLSKEKLRQYWPTILKSLRPPFDQYLTRKYIEDLDIEPQVIRIYFKFEHRGMAERLNKSKDMVQKIFQRVLEDSWGVEFGVRLKKSLDQNKPISSSAQSETRQVQSNLEEDELIQEALKLGGTIKQLP